MEKIMSPAQLWQDFDPTAEKLDTDILRREEKNGYVREQLYFTGRNFGDTRRSRVYAEVCYKNTQSVKPAMLIIDDVRKRADFEELEFWASNGFVAMSVDFAGQRDKGLFTLYPEDVRYANAKDGGDDFYISSTAKETKWYEYALCGMRAVTYLKSLEYVKSVSVVTVGEGEKVGLIILGIDKRVDYGVTVFGNLYCRYPYEEGASDETELVFDGKELQKHLEENEKAQAWVMGLSPQSYVPLITVPLYVICAGNSGYVDIVQLSKTFYRVNDKSRLLILPSVVDYLPNDYAQCVVKWCKGRSASADMTLSRADDADGWPAVRLTSDMPADKLQLWYCRDASRKGKNWVRAPLAAAEDGYLATLDVYEENCDMLVFALYDGEIALSTALFEVRLKNRTRLRKPSNLLYSGETDTVFVPLNKGDNWRGQEIPVSKCKGYLGIAGTKGKAMATFAVGDKCVNNVSTEAISFDICCDGRRTITVYAVCGFGYTNSVYFAQAEAVGDGKWQRITLETADFHRKEDGKMLVADDKVDMFGFVSENNFIINNIYLV